MKKNTLLRLYTGDVPEIVCIVKYQKLVQKRREIYEYIDRHKQLPVSAEIGNVSTYDDLCQHYACKLASSTSSEITEEFIMGEVGIFKQRINRSPDDEIVKIFIIEYIARLQYPITYQIEEGVLNIKIDEETRINWIGRKSVHEETAQELMRIYTKNRCTVTVYSHFTKYYSIKSEIAKGFCISGTEGIRNILIRGFMDLLRNSTQALYLSGVPQQYVVNKPAVTIESMKLQKDCVPPCISKVLENLKIKKHLKFDDRTNLSNFLKSAGVPIEDAIAMFRANFNMTQTDFDKKYKYPIQHTYGLVGSRINYKGVPCTKIVSETNKENCTGCPYATQPDPQRKCTLALEKITKKKETVIVSPSEYYLRAVRAIAPSEDIK